jgi:Mg-chelatase subunit ChlD
MMVAVFSYFAWLAFSPINFLFGLSPGTFPPAPLVIVNSILYIPLIFLLIRRWLRTMMNRKRGPAAGIDTVEPGKAVPEPGDEWGTATRPYESKAESKVTGSKSDIRETPLALDDGFFVKTPDMDSGQPIFDPEKLKARAMVKSKVSSGGWSDKSVSSRATGSLKASETEKHGRPTRSRRPHRELSNIHLPSTLLAAVLREGKYREGKGISIKAEDIRETVFTGKTPLTVILVIDVSLSMKRSMSEVRKMVEKIERETRGSKDRVGIIAFKDSGAIEIQAPTTNWNKIYRSLAKLRISGLTPLADGLMKSLETIKRERMRNDLIEPLIIVISDFNPNIPLAQSAGPGHERYTPIRDLVRASRILRKQKIRVATVSVDYDQANFSRFLKRPFHEAMELAALLRMRKDGYNDVMETILSVPAFRKTFGAYIIARASGGHAFLSKELMKADSVIGTILAAIESKTRMSISHLREAESYLKK